MARRHSHTERRFITERSATEPVDDDVASRALEVWSHAAPDAPRPAQAPVEPAGTPVEYRVERLDGTLRPSVNVTARLESDLNTRAGDGWRLCAVVPAPPGGQLAIFERQADAELPALPSPAPATQAAPRPRTSRRRRAAGARTWDSARSRFASEQGADLLATQTIPPPRGIRPAVRHDVVRRRRSAVLASALALAAFVVLAVGGLGALSGGDAGSPSDDRAAASNDAPPANGAAPTAAPRAEGPVGAASAAELPACRDVPRAEEARAAVTCRTGARVLTIAGAGISAEADGIKSRVLGVAREPGAILVRVGVRNRGDRAFDVQDMSTRAVLNTGGVRLAPAAPVPSDIVGPGRAVETQLRFATGTAAEAALAGASGRADLGLGDGPPARAKRLTVLRLRVPAAG